MVELHDPDSIVLHCYGKGTDRPQFDNPEVCRKWHVEENGWSDIGYHFIITKDGEIHHCRSLEYQGAHCADGGMNSRSIGICFTGEKEFTDLQYRSLSRLLVMISQKYDISRDDIYGHYQFSKTKTCPNYDVEKFKKYYL